MQNSNVVLALLAFLSFVIADPAFSQSQHSDAHLSGTLTDPSGAGVAEARIEALLEGSPASPLTTESGADGSYGLALPSGRYHIVITKDAFVTREVDLFLHSGDSRTLSLRMELAPMSSSVLVTGESAPTAQEQIELFRYGTHPHLEGRYLQRLIAPRRQEATHSASLESSFLSAFRTFLSPASCRARSGCTSCASTVNVFTYCSGVIAPGRVKLTETEF